MPIFNKIIQLLLLVYISASAVGANFSYDEYTQPQAEIDFYTRKLRNQLSQSLPRLCDTCSMAVRSLDSPLDAAQFEHVPSSQRRMAIAAYKYYYEKAQITSNEKYDGGAIPEGKRLSECNSLLRGNVLQNMRMQYAAIEFNNPRLDVLGLAYHNPHPPSSPDILIVALQQFITEFQHDSETYGCQKYFKADGVTAKGDDNSSSSSSAI